MFNFLPRSFNISPTASQQPWPTARAHSRTPHCAPPSQRRAPCPQQAKVGWAGNTERFDRKIWESRAPQCLSERQSRSPRSCRSNRECVTLFSLCDEHRPDFQSASAPRPLATQQICGPHKVSRGQGHAWVPAQGRAAIREPRRTNSIFCTELSGTLRVRVFTVFVSAFVISVILHTLDN